MYDKQDILDKNVPQNKLDGKKEQYLPGIKYSNNIQIIIDYDIRK